MTDEPRASSPTRRLAPLALPSLGLLALLTATGCGALRPAPTPMRVVPVAPGANGGRCAVVFLPGRYNRPEAFAKEGFARLLAESGVQAEVVAPDAHFGYYARRSVLDRLREDVIAPLRQQGRDRIWLVGISMGGTGSLLYAQQEPEGITGIVVLAPFLGEAEVLDEISAAGGLASWKAPEPVLPGDFERQLWKGLQAAARPGAAGAPIYLGFGTADSLAPGHRLLASNLPPDRVFSTPGGHDWPAWNRLWSAFLASGELQRSCQ